MPAPKIKTLGKSANDEPLLVGGQAVIEGVLMRTKERTAVAVRNDKGKIVRKEWNIPALSKRVKIFKYPFIRGVGVLYETTAIGFKALSFSANAAAGKDEKGADVLGKREMIFSFLFAFIVAILLFFVAPLYLTGIIVKNNSFLFNLIDGLLRLLAFLAYLALISLFRDVQRIFQYHGAEHMTIHAYEHRDPLLPAKIRKYPTMHPRCGTSFLLIVILLSILVFSVVSPAGFVLKLFSRLVLLPVIAGASYELLRLGAKFEKNILMRMLVSPGLLLQKITTKVPDDSQILVAVAALKEVLRK